MDLFARVNAVYRTFFGSSPPARACVAVDPPEKPAPYRLTLDCIAYAEESPSERQALHVQGLSYWAPANIGPYSQAITVSLVCNHALWLGARTYSNIKRFKISLFSNLVRLACCPEV